MSKFISSLVFVVCGFCAATSAWASPTLLYEFQLRQMRCVTIDSGADCGEGQPSRLQGLTIGLDAASVSGGTASLSIKSEPFGLGPWVNNGFVSLRLGDYASPGTGGSQPLDPSAYFSEETGGRKFQLDAELSVAEWLSGSLYTNNDTSELVMSTDKAFVLGRANDPYSLAVFDTSGPREWTGFSRSDEHITSIYVFSGEWRLVEEVPEPGTFALLVAALAGVLVAVKRRTTR